MTFTYPSGLTVTMAETGTTHITPAEMIAQNWQPVWDGGMRQSAYFNALGAFSPSPYSVSAIENAQQPVWYSLTYFGDLYGFNRRLPVCPITAARGVEMRCSRDAITFTFNRPVTDPVLHINNIGANSYSDSSEWDNQRQLMHSNSIITLDLANSAYTGTPDLTLLSGVGDIEVVRDGAAYLLDGSDSRLIGAPAIARTSSQYVGIAQYVPGGFGAGSVKVKGTWTTITFNRDLLWRYDTYNPQNRPDKVSVAGFFQHQGYNECILDQLIVAGPMYRCSLNGSTWSPNQSLTTPGWGSTLLRTAVEESIQLQNPTPEGISYLITVDEDFGTAPASYDATNGASHVVSNLKIGATASSTAAESPSTNGGLDNSGAQGIASPNSGGTDAGDDAFASNPVLPQSGDYTASIPLSGINANAKLCGWIDVNGNGTFESGERQCATVTSGATSANLVWPASDIQTVTASTWMRLRLSYDTTGVESPLGRVDSGEVEDWRVIPFSLAPTTTAPATTVASNATPSLPATGRDVSHNPWWATVAISFGVLLLTASTRRRRHA